MTDQCHTVQQLQNTPAIKSTGHTYLHCVCCVNVWCRYPHCIRGRYTDVHHNFVRHNVLLLFCFALLVHPEEYTLWKDCIWIAYVTLHHYRRLL